VQRQEQHDAVLLRELHDGVGLPAEAVWALSQALDAVRGLALVPAFRERREVQDSQHIHTVIAHGPEVLVPHQRVFMFGEPHEASLVSARQHRRAAVDGQLRAGNTHPRPMGDDLGVPHHEGRLQRVDLLTVDVEVGVHSVEVAVQSAAPRFPLEGERAIGLRIAENLLDHRAPEPLDAQLEPTALGRTPADDGAADDRPLAGAVA